MKRFLHALWNRTGTVHDAADDWSLWYCDTFDRECPPKVEVSGHGLVHGLMELWARYLLETVQADGQQGFSSFHLETKRGRVWIDGDPEGAKRLRGWALGNQEQTDRGHLQDADLELLGQIANSHAWLIEKNRTAKEILVLAALAADRSDFMHRLEELVA